MTEESMNRIKWLLAHSVWTYETTVKVPPDGSSDDFLGPSGPDWVDETVVMGDFHECIMITIVFVDPDTDRIEDEVEGQPRRNTALRVWLEGGPWYDAEAAEEVGWQDHNRWLTSHDCRLDCGGATVEEALLKLADLVEKNFDGYGKDRGLPFPWDEAP